MGIVDPQLICGDCLNELKSLDTGSVSLVIGSPPYHGKMKRYGNTGSQLTDKEWAAWMLQIVTESVRVSKGFVIIVANGMVRKRRYFPSCERLMVLAHDAGIVVERPVIWHKNATPSRKDWFTNDWEFCLAFRRPESNPIWNWESIAEPPKFKAGGAFRQRSASGKRVKGGEYPQSKLARPRDVLRVTVGGGHMGSKLAHESEAPYPEKIVEPFVKLLTNIGDIVLDPFLGSGTTLAVAGKLKRRSIGIDNRESQIELTKRRLRDG